jgi:hypothetical protein
MDNIVQPPDSLHHFESGTVESQAMDNLGSGGWVIRYELPSALRPVEYCCMVLEVSVVTFASHKTAGCA